MMHTNMLVKRSRFLALALGSAITCFGQAHVPLLDPKTPPIPLSRIQVGLQPVASGLVAPVWGTFAPGDHDYLYVLDQPGQLWRIRISDNRDDDDDNGPKQSLFLDVSSRLVKLGLFPPLNYDERGFLGVAFHPDYRRNGLFYTLTSEVVNGKADFTTLPVGTTPNAQTVITEWRVDNPRNDDYPRVNLASARELMRIDKPQFNHNGGTLAFGPDRMLYISLGDGGGANDKAVGHVPGGNAQSLAPGNVLGKILRIDPLGRNSANGQYGIPPDNPFVEAAYGAPEIWAYGFRNPYRISFDSEGILRAGDVGQNDIEELDIVEKGGNYGWPIKEGTFLFDNGSARPAPNTNVGFVYQNSPGSPAGLIDPIAEYDHADAPPPAPKTRVAIVGGFFYEGRRVRSLRDHYLFGDYSGAIGTPVAGHLFTLEGSDQHIEQIQVAGRPSLGLAVLGFAEDSKGELYLLANQTGTLNGTTGQVLKITRVREKEY